MKITVNQTSIELFSGATVMDALRHYYSRHDQPMPYTLPPVTDKYGNRVATDGALTEGNELFIKTQSTMKSTKRKLKTLLKKRFIQSVILVLITSLYIGCGSTRRVAPLPATDKTVEILAVNDMHAAIDNFPRFAFMVDSLRAIYPNLLLVSGGDNQTGNPVNDQYAEKGMPIIELMNAVGFDISAVGNHEFDSKLDGFSRITQRATFPFVSSNLTLPSGDAFRIEPYKILTLSNGVKVGFVSMLHINTTGIPDTHPDNVVGFTFQDPFETAHKYLNLKQDADVLVYLNHFGFENDVELANRVPHRAIDLIIGGHSHTRVEDEQIHNGIFITQAERKLKYASLIHLTVKPDGTVERSMELLTVNPKGNERADIRAMVDKFNDNPTLNKQIAVAEDDFTSYEQLGYLMVDALRAKTKTDIALINPGGVRTDYLPKGNVSTLQVYILDPFGNEIVKYNLTGNELKAMHLTAYEVDEHMPLYPSGIKSRYILADDGSLIDVQFLTLDGEPLDMNKTYTVSMNSYMASVYKYDHKDPGTGLFLPTAESMIEYLRELKNIPSYREEKRIEIVKGEK